MAATVTQQNVKFNGVLDNAAVLRNEGGIRTLILTDDLSASDRAILDAFVDEYGSNPLSSASTGKARVTYASSATGSTDTGLVDVETATAGTLVVAIDDTITEASETDLPTEFTGSGYLHITPPVGTDYNSPMPGVLVGSYGTSGTQTLLFTANTGSGSATGLANDATVYTATVSVDGAAPIEIEVTGSDAQTFINLVNDIFSQVPGIDWNAAGDQRMVFSSNTVGAESSIEFIDVNLFSSITTNSPVLQAPVQGTDGEDSGDYTLSVSVDDQPSPMNLTFSGLDMGSFGQFANVLNSALGGDFAGATYENDGFIRVYSTSTGSASQIRIIGGTLIDVLLAGGSTIGFPVPGFDREVKYSLRVLVDGTNTRSITASGTDLETYGDLVDVLNAGLEGAATAFLSDNTIVIQSDSTGPNSSVVLYGSDSLFQDLDYFDGYTEEAGVAPREYSVTLTVNGVAIPVVAKGSDLETFTEVLAVLNTALGSAGTATLTGGVLQVASATTGAAASVKVSNDQLFRFIAGFAGTKEIPGAANLVDAMSTRRNGSAFLFDLFNVIRVGAKPARPAVPAVLPKTPEFTYYGGSPATWRYLEDDALVNPA